MSFNGGSPSRLFIFGWDCADWVVIEEGWKRGMLQNLRSLADRGESGTLISTLPPVTAPAWTSFLTGTDPGEHGIFGFRSTDPESYGVSTVPGGQRKRPTLLKLADDSGYRTCLVTVPWTYPADHVARSAVVPGWDAPDESFDSSHPPELRAELASRFGHVPRLNPPRSGARRFLGRQRGNIGLREGISNYLIDRIDPHIFMTVFPEPDQATHLFWRKTEVPSALLDAYEVVDQAMGRMIRRHTRPTDRVLVVSDHGARPLHTYVHVGKLLADGGFLTLAAGEQARVDVARVAKRRIWYRLPPRLRNSILLAVPRRTRRRASRGMRRSRVDWSSTRAFPRNDGPAGLGVQINVCPPYTSGPVSRGEYDSVRREVMTYLSAATDPQSGQKVFSHVLTGEEAYEGPEVPSAPDLLLLPSPGYGTRTGFDFTESLSRVSVGGHRREGMFVSDRPMGLEPSVQIQDLLPRVLASCGYELRSSVGRGDRESSAGYSEVEAEEMESRLRDLGYIE